ncbi:MAG: polymerase sigma-54 factor [Pseudomonadota bacterium]|jgi:RNA polymerase sigma-54 factor
MVSRQGIKVTATQRLQLSMQLQASIRLLRADAVGLTRYLEEQAAENPALVLGPAPMGEWLPRWDGVLGDAGAVDRVAAAGPSLMAHVMEAVEGLRLSPRERRIAEALADGLEPSGWLGVTVEAVARSVGEAEAAVAAVLARLQRMEPAGLFGRSLAECLRLQAEAEGIAGPVVLAVIGDLRAVAAGEAGRIARRLGVAEAEVEAAVRAVRGLDPKPGAQFGAFAAPVREPDVIARRRAEGWEVSLNRSSLPTLAVRDGRGEGQGAARALLRLVEARNATLLRVAREVLRRQEAALDGGVRALVPMTMADVAGALALHESTVSRVVAGTSVDTPGGTLWLRALFSGALGEGGASAAALRARLAEVVAAEDRARPLSDAALVAALGGVVARRTVAAWREALGIPPAHRRRMRR